MEFQPPNGNKRILIIDDESAIRQSIVNYLEDLGYEVLEADNGLEGITSWLDNEPHMILVDLMMPMMDGFGVLTEVHKKDPNLPIIVISGTGMVQDAVRALQLGAWDFVMKPITNMEVLLHSIVRALERSQLLQMQVEYQEKLEQTIEKRTQALQTALSQISQLSQEVIFRLARASEFRDDTTGYHIRRMSLYTREIARCLGKSNEFCENILWAAPMHDLGKIGIPDEILRKPGPLTQTERKIMEKHTIIGAKILESSQMEVLETARIIALYHHERWDGSGYPVKLSGTAIPLEARIVSVADVFDALSSKRPYKGAMETSHCLDIITKQSGTAFDPDVVRAFVMEYENILKIKSKYMDKTTR